MNEKEKAPGKGNKPDEEAQAIDDAEAEGIAGGFGTIDEQGP